MSEVVPFHIEIPEKPEIPTTEPQHERVKRHIAMRAVVNSLFDTLYPIEGGES